MTPQEIENFLDSNCDLLKRAGDIKGSVEIYNIFEFLKCLFASEEYKVYIKRTRKKFIICEITEDTDYDEIKKALRQPGKFMIEKFTEISL